MAPVARRCITCPPAASLPKGSNPPAVDLHKLTHALTDATKVNLEPWTSHACATPNFTLYTLQGVCGASACLDTLELWEIRGGFWILVFTFRFLSELGVCKETTWMEEEGL